MTVKITYETSDGIDTIQRDSHHTDQAPLLTALDDGGANFIQIPIRRVIKIERVQPHTTH